MSATTQSKAPSPMAGPGKPVDWMFAFKLNAAYGIADPKDEAIADSEATPLFDKDDPDEEARHQKTYKSKHCQQYVFASSANPTLAKGDGCLGATKNYNDPLAATFDQIYNSSGLFYVVWNDQLKGHPIKDLESPWGHSKGILAWNAAGEGMVLQVSTPSWPASGSAKYPREGDGNTLGYITDDDVEVSQHFFALKLTKSDVLTVLAGLVNSGAPTKQGLPQLVQNGGPKEVQDLVAQLGQRPSGNIGGAKVSTTKLTSGVTLISKPSGLHVPPWQMVSAKLNGVGLRVASWWDVPWIPSTSQGQTPGCWSDDLGVPGEVQIAVTGLWNNVVLGLKGKMPDGNHAKIGVSLDAKDPYCIFGDMNQQGALAGDAKACGSSQNGRGGLFFVMSHPKLWQSLTSLLKGDTAGPDAPKRRAMGAGLMAAGRGKATDQGVAAMNAAAASASSAKSSAKSPVRTPVGTGTKSASPKKPTSSTPTSKAKAPTPTRGNSKARKGS